MKYLKYICLMACFSRAVSFNAARSKRDVDDADENKPNDVNNPTRDGGVTAIGDKPAPAKYDVDFLRAIYETECHMESLEKGCDEKRCMKDRYTVLGPFSSDDEVDSMCSESENPYNIQWECHCQDGRGGLCCQFEDPCGEDASFQGIKMKTCREHLNGKGLMWYGDAGRIRYTNDSTVGTKIRDLKTESNILHVFDISKPVYQAGTHWLREPFDTSIFGCKVTNDPQFRLGRICYALGTNERQTFVPIAWNNELPVTVFKHMSSDESFGWWRGQHWSQSNKIPDSRLYTSRK